MPQTTRDIINAIATDNMMIVSKMFHDLIKEHETKEGHRTSRLYLRYKQDSEGVPVYNKEFANYEKVHKKLPNDFYGDIVDLKTGYMGNEIVIDIDERKVTDAQIDVDNEFLQNFAQENNTPDLNSELVKMAAATGKMYRLLYVSGEDGEASLMNSEPWETAVFKDASLKEPRLGMRYFTMKEYEINTGAGNQVDTKERYRLEWYDQAFITYYRENKDGIFEVDLTMPSTGQYKGTGQQPHFFNGVPIIEFRNNEEDKAEPEKAIELIDAYNDIISDAVNEVEQLRMAYLWARGAGMVLDAELEDQLKQTGIWTLPADGEIGFVGKNLGGASEFVQSVLAEIRRNIYSFSKSIDLSNDKGGDMRVIGWQVALLRLEMSASVTERKFKKGYNRQFKMLTDFWREMGKADIDPMTLRYTFTRKFPKDIDMEMDTLLKAMEVLPIETAYGLMSFIDNPAELAEKYKEDKPEMGAILTGLDDAQNGLE